VKPLALSAAVLVLAAVSASALTPQTEAFLRSIGLDPQSPSVLIAERDGEISTTYMDEPVVYSIEKLAAQKSKNQVTRFIGTRSYYARLKADYKKTPLPTQKDNYEALYLTVEERKEVSKKVMEFYAKD